MIAVTPVASEEMAELKQAVKAFESSITKCEKALAKLKDGSWQKEFVNRQLSAFYMAVSLIANLLGKEQMNRYLNTELDAAIETLDLLIDKCEKIKTKFAEGSSQKTLADRRLKAFNIALRLIKNCGGVLT